MARRVAGGGGGNPRTPSTARRVWRSSGKKDSSVARQRVLDPPPARVARGRRGLGGRWSGPYVLTLIVYERERRALGSFLAPSALGAASCSSRRRPESLPAQLRPPGSPC